MKIWYIVTTSKSYQDEIFKSNTAPLLAETIVTDRNVRGKTISKIKLVRKYHLRTLVSD